MTTADPLFFLTEQPVSNNNASQGSAAPTINPTHFVLNVVFVLVILYLTLLLIRLVYRKTSTTNPNLLKEISLGQTSKLQYIKVGERLYLLAQNGTQMVLVDTITDPKAIINILNEIKDSSPIARPLTWFSFLNGFKKNKSVEIEPEQFDSTLKKILQNSNKLEDLNNR